MKKSSIIILLTLSLNVFCQIKSKEEINIEISKAKLVDNVSVFGIRQLKVTSEDLKKVMIKTKISSDPDNKTKLSAFSLVDTINKIRYRLADYKGYTGIIGNPELIPYRKTELYDKKGNKIDNYLLPPFDSSEKDYFNDYNKLGYTNFELPINFGTTKNPNLSILYFGETSYKKFTAELYFAIPVINKDLVYRLFYKDKEIGTIIFN